MLNLIVHKVFTMLFFFVAVILSLAGHYLGATVFYIAFGFGISDLRIIASKIIPSKRIDKM